jgi:hypothetical protein
LQVTILRLTITVPEAQAVQATLPEPWHMAHEVVI